MRFPLFVFVILLSGLLSAQEKSTVKPFLPEIMIQFPNVRDFTISPLEDEAFFTVQSPVGDISAIVEIHNKNGSWSEPEIVSFSGKYKDLEPFLSPDELRLYFASNRPLDKSTAVVKDFDIWYSERSNKNEEWSEPKNIGSPINTEHNEFYPSITTTSNLYFTSDKPGSKGKDDIYVSIREDNHYLIPNSLSTSINSEGYEFNAFIAPDESFIMFSGYDRADGIGSGDLYVSYKTSDNLWSEAKSLEANINSEQMDYCPFVNTKTGMLYFTSRRIEFNLKEEGFTSMSDLMNEIDGYQNGLSRIYKVSMKEILP